MKKMLFYIIIVPCLFFLGLPNLVFGWELKDLKMPSGFEISVYANVDNARQMAYAGKGILFVGTRAAGKVYMVFSDENFKVHKVQLVDSGFRLPSGVAFFKGDLYVADVNRVLRYPNILENLNSFPEPEVVNNDLPEDRHHGWKYIKFSPDGKLYVPVGAPCNVCLKSNKVYATILEMDAATGNYRIFAAGIRNSVGFDWHPETKELWFTDNGRDLLGDNLPPDELNHAPMPGLHFGFPYYYGDNQPDPQYGKEIPLGEYRKPAQKLGPHVASIGMLFYQGKMFPNEYQTQILIAEHGSWNRSEKIGYRISLVKLKNNQAVSYLPFISGWEENGVTYGRPADLITLEDGSLLISDDYAGKIYRVIYRN